ncbi:MAG: TolC family protein [Cytophagales bacterium]|nr:TolC family protein [Cytophagales bacterium]
MSLTYLAGLGKIRNGVLATLLLLTPFLSFSQDESFNIGVVTDCDSEIDRQFVNRILAEARILVDDYVLVIEDRHYLKGDCSAATVKANLDRLLADPDVDMVLGIDVIASHLIAKNGPYNKPAIGNAVINAQAQDIPITSKGTSGVDNVSYLELPLSPQRDLEVFNQLVGFEKVAIVIDESVFKGIPELKTFLEDGINADSLDYEFINTEKTASGTLAKLSDHDAVYFLPSNELTDAEFQQLINGVNERGLKSFSVLGRLDVDRGVLAGVAPASNIDLFTRRTALNIQRIINDENPKKFGVKVNLKEELVLNMATARAIDFSPGWDLLSEAVLLNEERLDIDRNISIFDAIAEGIGENLTLNISKQDVEIQAKEVTIAQSNLLPDLTANASHTTVDKDLASVSNGQNPQNRGAGSLAFSQLIYAESAVANRSIQQYLYEAEKANLESQTLDIILEVSNTYLQLMQAKTLEKIQRQNLEVTRKNLELARIGTSIGQTGPSDLYRWQGEIANGKSNLLNATAQRKQAEIALNQILNRPIDEEFGTQEIDLLDSRYIINNPNIDRFINNPRDYKKFSDFLVATAMKQSPDLASLEQNVKAIERSLLLNKRNQYIPNVSVSANYNQELYRSGAGTEFVFGDLNKWNWNVGVGASLPIFQGGRRKALVQQSQVQVMQIGTQKTNLQRIIEQQVRSQMEQLRASYTNIELAKEAEEATVKNFELVQDAYSQGSVLITQLLDAQNAAISSQLNSANVIYQFLIDLLTMERATGSYYMLLTTDQRTDFESELASYFSQP